MNALSLSRIRSETEQEGGHCKGCTWTSLSTMSPVVQHLLVPRRFTQPLTLLRQDTYYLVDAGLAQHRSTRFPERPEVAADRPPRY